VYVDQMRDDVRGRRGDPSQSGRAGGVLTGTGAVFLLAGVSAVGGLLDVLAGSALRLIFAAGLVLGTLLASLLVLRRDLLTVVFAPPLVFVAASAVAVLLRRGATGGGLVDVATSWLVYGFPAMATATAVAVVIWLIRRDRAR
jgi:Domain of unknown function (DUF6542)